MHISPSRSQADQVGAGFESAQLGYNDSSLFRNQDVRCMHYPHLFPLQEACPRVG